ncbi:hypothetical protein PLICRDRAFT_181283 [Plicaturopsis crispa FD-325 SS-3]|nr:hypothetical protein PLICRDRAFT_181283 [Plicaturopsis crispa FD-325 SS-3]
MPEREVFSLAQTPITAHAFNADRSQVAVSFNSNNATIFKRQGNEWKETETLSRAELKQRSRRACKRVCISDDEVLHAAARVPLAPATASKQAQTPRLPQTLPTSYSICPPPLSGVLVATRPLSPTPSAHPHLTRLPRASRPRLLRPQPAPLPSPLTPSRPEARRLSAAESETSRR